MASVQLATLLLLLVVPDWVSVSYEMKLRSIPC